MAEEYRLTVDEQPPQAEVEAIRAWLADFNLEQAGPQRTQRVTILVRDGADRVVGGLLGFVNWGWLRIDILVVHEAARGRGIGSRLLAAAEAEARRHECQGLWLDTFSWQAPDFYERHGYQIFGTLADCPPGQAHHFMHKRLPQGTGGAS
jgi:GNAT superfamily N-acetyltransferase